jgi:hypothetical protein
MKKTTFSLLALLLLMSAAKAQILQPVHWSYAAKKISATEAVLFMKATIDPGWHIYSQYVKDGGPVKTSFIFTLGKDYTLSGTTAEPKPISRMEKVFGMEVGFFEKSVVFQQKIRLKKGQVNVEGKLEYMTCNDQKCLPPDDLDFSIAVK